MNYDILLLNVQRSINRAFGFNDNLGLHSIASYLGAYNFQAKVLGIESEKCLQILKKEIENYGVKIIGFYAGCDSISAVENIITWLKKNYQVIVLVGGPQSIALKEDFLRKTQCDFAVVGEGEIATLQLLEYLIAGKGELQAINNLRYLDKDSCYVETPWGQPLENLDLIGFPKPENSLNTNYRLKDKIGILTGRGCPYNCSFCYEGANSKILRFRSIANVFAEIDEVLAYNQELQYVNIFDDTFTLDLARVQEFCQGMKQRNLLWFCEAHVQNLLRHPHMIKMMVDSGLVSLQIGIESGNNRVLEAYNKHTTAEKIMQVVQNCKEAGLCSLFGNFIIGGAWESPETIQDSMTLASRLLELGRGMFEAHTVFLAPYPQTAIEKQPEKFGLTIHADLMQKTVSTMSNAVVSSQEMNVQEIITAQKRFEQFLDEEYEKQVELSNKEDFLQCLFYKGRPVKMNVRWMNAYLHKPHFEGFYRTKGFTTELSPEKYPIRTFEKLDYQEEFLVCDIYKFTGLKKAFLENCCGRYTIAELGQILEVPVSTIIDLFAELNYLCLVYLSDF